MRYSPTSEAFIRTEHGALGALGSRKRARRDSPSTNLNIPTPAMKITATTAGAGGIAIHLGSSSISPTNCCARNVLKSTDERDQEERGSKNDSPSYDLVPVQILIGTALLP
jgi:hypothetical protein